MSDFLHDLNPANWKDPYASQYEAARAQNLANIANTIGISADANQAEQIQAPIGPAMLQSVPPEQLQSVAGTPVSFPTSAPIAQPPAQSTPQQNVPVDLGKIQPPAQQKQAGSSGTGGIDAAYAKAFGEARVAEGKAAELAQQRATVEANEAKREALDLQLAQQKHDRELAIVNAQAQDAYEQRQALIDERKNTKIDPNRFLKNSLGGGIVAGIGVALGQIGASLLGQRNTALDIINNAIDKDVRAQESNLAKLGDDISAKQNDMAHFRQLGFDERERFLAGKSIRLEQTKNFIAQKTAGVKNQEILNNAQRTIAGIDLEEAKVKDALLQHRQMLAAKAQGPSLDDQVKLESLKVDIPTTSNSKDPLAEPDGVSTVRARSADDAKKVKEILTTGQELRQHLLSLRSLIEANPIGTHIDPSTRKQVEAKVLDLITLNNQLKGQGAMGDAEYERNKSLLGSASGMQFNSTTYKLINDFGRRTQASIRAHLLGKGLIAPNDAK